MDVVRAVVRSVDGQKGADMGRIQGGIWTQEPSFPGKADPRFGQKVTVTLSAVAIKAAKEQAETTHGSKAAGVGCQTGKDRDGL